MSREQWDAIVVGSGLGGLGCAAYLSAAGKRTLVLEAHYVAGGNSQVFRRAITVAATNSTWGRRTRSSRPW